MSFSGFCGQVVFARLKSAAFVQLPDVVFERLRT